MLGFEAGQFAGGAITALTNPQPLAAGPTLSSNGNVFVAPPGLGNLSELLNRVESAPSQNGGGYYAGSAVPLTAYQYPQPSNQPIAPVQTTVIPNSKIWIGLGVGLIAAFLFIR